MQERETSAPKDREFSEALKQLEKESNELKKRIENEKRIHNLPLDQNPDDPARETEAADRRSDFPDKDEAERLEVANRKTPARSG